MTATDEQIERLRVLAFCGLLTPENHEALAAVLGELTELRAEVERLKAAQGKQSGAEWNQDQMSKMLKAIFTAIKNTDDILLLSRRLYEAIEPFKSIYPTKETP